MSQQIAHNIRARQRQTQQRQTAAQMAISRNKVNGLLKSSTQQLEQRLHREQRSDYPLGRRFIISLGLIAVTLVFVWWFINNDWLWVSDWLWFWLIVAACGLFAVFRPVLHSDREITSVLALRLAAVNGDDKYAPPVAQPEPASDNLLQARYLGPFAPLIERRYIFRNAQASWPLGLLYIINTATVTSIAISSWPDIGTSGLLLLETCFFLLLVFVVFLQMIYYWRKGHERKTLLITPEGIALRGQRRTPVFAEWRSIRSLCVEAADTSNSQQRTFIIDANTFVFAWVLTAKSSIAEQEASNEALRLIMGQTGLPLRDISAGIKQVIEYRDRPRGRARWQVRVPAAYRASLVLMALVIVAGLVIEFLIQPQVYQAHLTDITSQTPLITYDSVTLSDYQPFIFPQSYGDVTLIVTVRQQSDFDLSSSGLVLRDDPATNSYLTWGVTQSGQWWLQYYSRGTRHAVEIINSPGINTADGAANTLAVIMRGNVYSFYINGQFVGTYLLALPTSGQVGFFLEGTAQSATFTNFAVYATPPRSWQNALFLA